MTDTEIVDWIENTGVNVVYGTIDTAEAGFTVCSDGQRGLLSAIGHGRRYGVRFRPRQIFVLGEATTFREAVHIAANVIFLQVF